MHVTVVHTLLLLRDDHDAVPLLKRLLYKVPVFHFNTPILYTYHQKFELHRKNMDMIGNFLHHHQESPPSRFLKVYSQKNIPSVAYKPHLGYNNPLYCLKRALKTFDLMILPADKNKTNVIISQDTLRKEMLIHLSDSTTYRRLDLIEYESCNNFVLETVKDASTFYKAQLIV